MTSSLRTLFHALFEENLKKVARKFGIVKNLIYLCSVRLKSFLLVNKRIFLDFQLFNVGNTVKYLSHPSFLGVSKIYVL